jgi:PKD repeat protein
MKHIYKVLTALFILVAGISDVSAQSCNASYTFSTAGNTANFTDASTTSSGSIVSWTWNFGDGNFDNVQNPSHTYTWPGQYVVTLNIATNTFCFDSYTDTVIVNGGCTASYTYSVDTTNGQVNFQAAPVAFNLNYSWDFGDSTTGTGAFVSNTYAPGTYNVCLIVADNAGFCADTICDTVMVTGSCNASFTYTVDTTNGQVNFQADPLSFNYSYSWDFGDSTTGTGPFASHFYASGSYLVCLMISDPSGFCTDTICDTVMVTGSCNANFTYSVDTTSGDVSFQAQPLGPNFSYVWDFGDSTTGSGPAPVHTYAASGTYYVCLTVLDSAGFCNDTICDSVVVYIAPVTCPSSFTASDQGNGNAFFQAQPFSFGGTYDWDFGDGNLGQGFVTAHQYAMPGTYYVCLIYTNAAGTCSSTFCDSVTVAADPSCPLTFNYFANELDVSFFANPFTFNNNAVYSWTFGDSNTGTGQNITHTYAAPGTYYVCVNLTDQFNGCNETFCDSVTVTLSGIEEYGAAINLNSYPNPFASSTFIEYMLPNTMNVEIAVFDLLGNKVEVIANENQGAGFHRIEWNAEKLSKGAYLLKVTSASGTAGRLLIKN